ncbi:MAG: ABC transporter ATP-binding protein [Desulfosoma sp.]|uniref:ABC transporter ATP-binding protein n=1 Tax=Desulfosoma sp. TaxID=2603217 RepID=UPI00404B120A
MFSNQRSFHLFTPQTPPEAPCPVGSIRLRAVTKSYRLYARPTDRLKEALLRRPYHRPFHSVQNVSLDVAPGESLGIIGDNGAGKSTLLKIVAGTLSPTSGEVQIGGRVAALLELGAGFHPEFTGRKNIYLNASLLGLSDAEIRRCEPRIIDFAELGPFIDQPIKSYSSGMVVRLAFSIATSVDPDILVIDEALSVGDQYFQKKCIDRILQFQREGKTILFCSHSLYTVNLLCARAVWMREGSIFMDGAATSVTAAYENTLRERSRTVEVAAAPQVEERATPYRIRFVQVNGSREPLTMHTGQDLEIVVACEVTESMPFALGVGIMRNDGLVCHAVNLSRVAKKTFQGPCVAAVRVIYPKVPLLHGEFFAMGYLIDASGVHIYHQKESAPIRVAADGRQRTEVGLIEMPYHWEPVDVQSDSAADVLGQD